MPPIDLNKNILISIIVPCFNCEKTINRTVKSLIGQFDNTSDIICGYEIILVDDGSTDNTSYVLDEYSKNYEIIRVFHKKNGGLVDAWKSGVSVAIGEYIAFCDSDDYIDSDFVFKMIQGIFASGHPDMIAFGMLLEYSNGTREKHEILLKEGLYAEKDIKEIIYPRLLSNGPMQSELLRSSRCNKVFKKTLLNQIMGDVPNDISYGEDDITCFAAALNANSIYAIQDYYPYHYVRDVSSMIGGYDPEAFYKIDRIYKELNTIAQKYDYKYLNQIQKAVLSILVLSIKKEICKNPDGYRKVKNRLKHITLSDTYLNCFKKEYTRDYKVKEKIFVSLITLKLYRLSYYITKTLDAIRGRQV